MVGGDVGGGGGGGVVCHNEEAGHVQICVEGDGRCWVCFWRLSLGSETCLYVSCDGGHMAARCSHSPLWECHAIMSHVY